MASSEPRSTWIPPAVEELYRLLLGSLTDHALVLLDPHGRVAGWNEAAERLLGYRESEILTQDHETFYQPDDRQRGSPSQDLQAAVREGVIERAGWRVDKHGRGFWASVRTTALRDAESRLGGFAQLFHDRTDWQRLQERQREAEHRFRGIFDQTFEYVALLQPDGTLVEVNQPGLDFRGLTRADVVGRLLWESPWLGVGAETQQWLSSAVALAARGTVCRDELVLPGADGRRRSFDFSLKPVYSDLGQVVLLIAEARDVTERKRLEAQYLQAQKMEAVGQLAGGVAHDFNNMLTAIGGYSELLLLRIGTDDACRELVGEILKASERAAALTRQLLAFSRKALVEPRVLDLNRLVIDLEKMLGRIIGEDIELTTHLQPTLGRVKADPSQMEQVILNLIVNARDAMPQGGKVILETRNVELDEPYVRLHAGLRPGRFVLLTVSDTGCGMTPEVLAHLFEPFFTTKEKGKGTGLGLATVYGIVKQAGGHVAAYSEPAIGTTMKAYLPRVLDEGSVIDSQVGLHTLPRGSETVLLVEDEDSVRALARMVLKNNGYTVLEAANGDDALRCAELHTEPLHLLVTDVVMPGMSGRTLAERLLALHPELKVLYLSGYTADAVVRQGILQEQVHFLQKPFAAAALARKVRTILDEVL